MQILLDLPHDSHRLVQLVPRQVAAVVGVIRGVARAIIDQLQIRSRRSSRAGTTSPFPHIAKGPAIGDALVDSRLWRPTPDSRILERIHGGKSSSSDKWYSMVDAAVDPGLGGLGAASVAEDELFFLGDEAGVCAQN